MPGKSKVKVSWKGWSMEKPSAHERTIMKQKCGSKCFLGPGTSFPICKKNTCRISKKGVSAAYIRSREWKHKRISTKAKILLKK
jgi:hypothetical protein